MFEGVEDERRVLIEVDLQPLQGSRFQATGFPDLGAAEYEQSNGKPALLVESSQSMANRLEDVCLNDDKSDFVEVLAPLPMIEVVDGGGKPLTNSVREAHRINSYYILESDSKGKEVKDEFNQLKTANGWDTRPGKIAEILFKIDINSLLHGMWIAKKDVAGGRMRLPRAISSFIEATDAHQAISGGVKIDHVNPGKEGGGGAGVGQANLPYSRVEHTAKTITAYFNIDLEQIRKYRFSDVAQTELLFNLALWKVRKFLDSGLRLRTACDFRIQGDMRCVPSDFVLPDASELDKRIEESISRCKKHFRGTRIKVKHSKAAK